jgi:hypothetical protein
VNYCLLPLFRAGSFLGGDEPGAEVDADRLKLERCRQILQSFKGRENACRGSQKRDRLYRAAMGQPKNPRAPLLLIVDATKTRRCHCGLLPK